MIRCCALILALAAVAPAQTELVEQAEKASQELTRLSRMAKEAGHPKADTLDVLRRDLDEIKEEMERADRASRVPQVLLRMKLIEADPKTLQRFKLDADSAGEAAYVQLKPEVANELLADKKGKLLSNASLLANPKEESTIEVARRETVPWLERQEDGSYRMREIELDGGLVIKTVADVRDELPGGLGKGKTWVAIALDLSVAETVGRTPVEKDAKAIGLPIRKTRTGRLEHIIEDGTHVAGIFHGAEGQPDLLLVLKAQVLRPKKLIDPPGRLRPTDG